MPVRTHGLGKTRLYHIWRGMLDRCYKANTYGYKWYGARGIYMCSQWKSDFVACYSWAMANGYQENLTIDRKDSNGHYEPDNCRWITDAEQKRNRRDNRNLTLNGETLPLTTWAKRLGVRASRLWMRSVVQGRSDEETLHPGLLKVRLTYEQCDEIRRRQAAGEMQKLIASDFGCSPMTISEVVRRVRRYAEI